MSRTKPSKQRSVSCRHDQGKRAWAGESGNVQVEVGRDRAMVGVQSFPRDFR